MKKILAFLLAATMLSALFVLPSAAAEDINFEVEFDYAATAPVVDGKVGAVEYGALPIHTYSDVKTQFSQQDDHDEYDNWDIDFYGAWDKENLYLAWVVHTDIHKPLAKATYNADGTIASDVWPEDGSSLGYMWMYSFLQFILTPGAPSDDVSYASNYLEVGLCDLEDGEDGRCTWALPTSVTGVSVNDWDAIVERDEAAKTTTYEVAIPWSMSGVEVSGTDAKFGFAYAVGAQEFYTTKKGILEWQDAILGSKKADNVAIITLKGGNVQQEINDPNHRDDGEIPADLADKTVVTVIDKVNAAIAGEDTALITDMANEELNTKWAHNALLAPVEGQDGIYEIVEYIKGDGTTEQPFVTEITDGMIRIAVHSDGLENDAEANAFAALPIGTKVGFWGIDFDKNDRVYGNCMMYVEELGVVEEPSEEPSEEVSEEASDVASEEPSKEESKEESKTENKEESKEESKATTSTATSEAPAEEGGNMLWIILAAVAVVVVAVVVVVVLKKKKA